jgi:prepilin-type processing-associated H-X9-DG protein
VPGCSYQAPGASHSIPWPFDDADAARHYPPRHIGVFNTLFCDAHVVSYQKQALTLPLFYAY